MLLAELTHSGSQSFQGHPPLRITRSAMRNQLRKLLCSMFGQKG